MSAPIAHRHIALLVLQDLDTVRELELLMPFSEFVLAQVSPTQFVIDPARINELAEKLEARGFGALLTKQRSMSSSKREP